MPSYMIRYAGSNILAGFYSARDRLQLVSLLDERHDPSGYEFVVIPDGFGIEFYRDGGPLNLVIGDFDAGEALEDADGVYVTQNLWEYLWGDRELKWTPVL